MSELGLRCVETRPDISGGPLVSARLRLAGDVPWYLRRIRLEPYGKSNELVQQLLRFLQIGGVKALEPVVDRREEIAGIIGSVVPKLGKTCRCGYFRTKRGCC